VLLPEARKIFRSGGAIVDETTQMVRIGREIVESATASAPKSIHGRAGQPRRDLDIELGQLSFVARCGAPNVSDLDRGRRAGTLVTDMEAIQTIAELCLETPKDDDDFALEAIEEVQPGGHFFAAAHTMSCYRTAFYEPLVADLSNFGSWTYAGGKDATQRANGIWKQRLAECEAPVGDPEALASLQDFIRARTLQGGAVPVS